MPEPDAAYSQSAAVYDALYTWKDYAGEAARLHALITEYMQCADTTLLDVACGTGRHLAFLREQYTVAGLDREPDLLAAARARNPGVPFHQGDMVDFDLGRRFAVLTCLFSAIGYVQTVARLQQTLATFARHVLPGGVILIEPWLTAAIYRPGKVSAQFVNDPDLKVARMSVSEVAGNLSVMDMHYLVATPNGVRYFSERHALAMFTEAEYRRAFTAAGLTVAYDPEGLMGRGLYIGTRPLI